ncbi:homoserine dehydrogenase [Amphiplicatus metriothermophilus]|uniref:Homoserine dehydrogenase n=1 Tax=Amphiplicatus metriothermophilus TaxID=1519374 RepID=A0A239PQH2_9PROT|nr:homoserine dehydrogenase [Amphiplicatus metriothermophilus]MBB5518870.1 homoserine dehydrogenase [Amphiplicatus metriothermophilus]SNT71977.1 homoserine dehydrogenase [Amphiplicatus metriothermophilus]
MSKEWSAAPAPLRVALLGFGVVGGGVYDLLLADQKRFQVVGVACRDPERHIRNGAPHRLLTNDPAALPEHDILVEAIGGLSPAEEIIANALRRGIDVVTANKSLVSRRYETLHAAAEAGGARLRFSAAVGGGVPMLETVEEVAREGAIIRLDAVLNGTTNFVLDRIGAGLGLTYAIRLAQEAGFAEADPTADIDGVDAAEKLSLIVRRAFGVAVDPAEIPRDALGALSSAEIAAAHAAGRPYKQVATARRTAGGLELEVRLRRAPADTPLGRPKLEENCLVIEREFGAPVVLFGKGAGREATAGSVFADLDALAHMRLGASLAESAA